MKPFKPFTLSRTFLLPTTLLVCMAILLQGCAQDTIERRIDRKLSEETNVKSRSDLSDEASNLIKNMPGLSIDQRARLSDLRTDTNALIAELTNQSLKLRGLLIRDVVSDNYDAEEVLAVKARLRALEEKRLTVMFETIDQANEILGRQMLHNRDIIDQEITNSMSVGGRSAHW